jgi:hypothetical protein
LHCSTLPPGITISQLIIIIIIIIIAFASPEFAPSASRKHVRGKIWYVKHAFYTYPEDGSSRFRRNAGSPVRFLLDDQNSYKNTGVVDLKMRVIRHLK